VKISMPVWFAFAGVFVGGLVAFWLASNPIPPAPVPVVAKPDPEFKKIVVAPKPAIAPEAKPHLSLECRNFWNGLRGLQLAELVDSNPRREPLPQGKACAQVPPELQTIHAQYEESCKTIANVDLLSASRANSPEVVRCRSDLMMYRAKLSDWLTREMPIAEIRDVGILSDKLIARFQDDPEEGGKIADRILEINPDLMPAAKASLMGRLIQAQKKSGEKEWEAVDSALDRVKRLAKADPSETFETETVLQDIRYRDLNKVKEKAKQISEENPSLGIGPYLQAWTKMREGDTPGAQALLKEAVRREPNTPRYQDSLKKLESGEAEPFRVGLSFSNPASSAL